MAIRLIASIRRGKPDQPGCLTPHSSNRSHAFSPINKLEQSLFGELPRIGKDELLTDKTTQLQYKL